MYNYVENSAVILEFDSMKNKYKHLEGINNVMFVCIVVGWQQIVAKLSSNRPFVSTKWLHTNVVKSYGDIVKSWVFWLV